MLRRQAAAVLLLVCSSSAAFAQQSYPTVIGASGQPYGPTQAEYQYQQRFGRPSPGSQGGGMNYVNGYPGTGGGGGSGYGYGGYSPYFFLDIGPYITPPSSGYVYYPSTAYYGTFGNTNYGFPYPQPFMGTASPAILQPLDPSQNGVIGNGTATFTTFPAITNPGPIIQPSTPKAVESSFEYQTQGDLQLQQLNYYVASERYRKAIETARDRADPRYRMAVSLAARSRFLEAVDQLKLAGQLDPTWPQHATSLGQLFGDRNNFEKTRVKQRVAEWTLQDARDPNRLLLLGALLYMDGDPNAKTMIDTAILVSGPQDYLSAFNAPRTEQIAPVQQPGNAAIPVGNAAPPLPNPPQPNMPRQADPVPAPQVKSPPAPPTADLPFPGKPIPAVPPLPEEVAPEKSKPADNNPLPPPESEDLSGPTLPPLP